MRIDILTIFPEMCLVPLNESMMKIAQQKGALELGVHNIRDFTRDRHSSVDDIPFGGGQGMVMKPEPIFKAVESVKCSDSRVVLMTPQGRPFQQAEAESFATCPHLIIICGHYEGVDHRVVDALVDDEISIGDYVLTNGTIAATVFTDAVVRLLPGVLGDERSAAEETFSEGLLEAPHYTRPAEFRGMKVPEVLLSGHHARIEEWRKRKARERTAEIRPDLLEKEAGERSGAAEDRDEESGSA